MKLLNKRILSFFLALVMLCGMMPIPALATENGESEANPWSGRSAVFVGDSITAGSGTTKTYYRYLEEALDLGSVTAMGVGGSCVSAYSDYGTGNQPLINRYQNIPSADLIMVFMGTNDYGHETPLGTQADTKDATFYGALNTIIPALVAKHTSSKIVFVTSLHRYGFGTSKILGTQFTYDNIPNGVGATLGDYVDALKTVCAKNGVSVIDLHTECTLDPTDAAVRSTYMPDGIHPNAAGHEVIAGIMESHLRTFEPVESEPVVLAEMVQGNKFASTSNQSCRASSRINYYPKAGTVITLKNPEVMQWACARTSNEYSSNNLGYFPESQWTDIASAVVAEDGWVGFTFKYRDETQSFDLTKPLSHYITIEEPHSHTYENGICTVCGEKEFSNSHQTENFRWEISNGKLTSITDANFSSNAATALGGSITNGVISSGRYQFAKPLSLLHDQPWAVEWRGSGDWTGMLLATTPDAYDAGLPYFFKTGTDSGLVAFGYKDTQVNNYGRSLKPLGLDYTQSHTYRLENRIHQDGSNMVYLLVDNVEIGPMNCFYIGGSNDQNQTVDWLSGKDFSISALGTTSHPINGIKLEYLQVMVGDHSHSYEAVATAPTCTEQGYTTYTCNCGASYVDDHVEAVWHSNENGNCSMCGCAMARITRDDITPSVGTVSSLDGTVNTTITTGWYWDIPIPEGAKQIRYMTFKTAASWGSAFLNGSTYISGVCETIEGYKWVTMDIPEGATIFRHGYLSDARAEQNGRPQFQYVEFSNAKQNISQYMPRPATGCHSFSVNVNIAPAMGDPDGNIVGTDYGYIMLPTNYTSYGEPTRLIIVCHGAGGKRSTYQSNSWKIDQNTFWTDMGYAIMDMAACPKPLTTDDRAIHYGNPTVVDCYKAGFDYVMENFNLKQDGIYVIGTSMGGLSSFQIVQSGKFPVLAQVGFCPAIDLFKQAYCAKWGSAERDYQKSHISSYFGFEGAPASFTNTFPTDAEIELYKNNFEKTVKYSPILCNVVDGDITSIFNAIPTSATGIDATEAAIYAQLTATHPCPVMIIHSKDDSVVSYRYSQYFVDMLKRSGQAASLYTIDGVNHMAWQYGKNCTLQGLNGQITIKESQYEAYKFFEKFEKHEVHQPWVDPAVKATCSTTGLTEGKHCASCGEILVNQNVIPTTNEHTYENGICTGCGATVSPYLQQLPENVIGCTNLYDSLVPVKGYYTATKYDTSNGAVLSVVIPVEPGDRIAASSFGPVSKNMGSVNGIRVTYLLGDEIVSSLSPGEVYSGYTSNGYITVPDGVDAVCVPWWKPSDSNWLTLSQISKNFVVHRPKAVPAQAPTCTEIGYTAGEICEICDTALGSREEIPPTGHTYSGDTCTVCGAVNLVAILGGKYVSILGDSISTFNGYSNDAAVNTTIGANGPRYDAGAADTKPGSYCLLESVEDTWWMHFANRSGMELLVNNSWAGSQVFGGKTSDGRIIPAAYLDRCVNLHDNTLENNPGNAPVHPDVIFVYLGINDYNFNRSNVGSGAVDYSSLVSDDGAYATPATFGEAYGIMLHKMRNAYPNAQIFAMTLLPENLYSVDKGAWEQHNAYIRAAAEYYDIPVVDLAENCAITWENYSGYMIDRIHPTTAGMKLISDCMEAELVAYYTENPPHTHSYSPTVTAPTCTEQGYTTYTCACGESYRTPWLDKSAYEGKTIACVGDSITCGIGVTKDKTDYVTLLAQSLGMEYIRLGVSGTTLCTDGSRTCNISRLTESYLDGADVVTIAMGINDFCAAGAGYYELGDINSTDSSTIYGAARMWCERIAELRKTERLKDTQFYFVTPVICSWNNSVTSARNWDQSKTNIHGYTLRDLCNAIIEVAELYDVAVIDLNLLSGMYYVSAEDNNTATFGGDGVHPGETGHQMMADAIRNILLQNHLRDDHTHTFGSWITTNWPDCEDGEQQRVCSVCSATQSRVVEAVDAHSYASIVTAPTCTGEGYTTYTCECGDSYVGDYVDALGHTEVVDAAVAPTCTAAGLTEGKHCSVCGEVLVKQNVIPALGHSYELGKCTVCGAADPDFRIAVEAVGEIGYAVSGSTVTVTHDTACKVGYLVDGAYVKIDGTMNPDGSYSFTAPEGVTNVLLVISGDVNGDGKLLAADKSRLNAALLKKTTLSAKEIFAADVNDDGKLLAADKSRLNAVLLKKTTLTW